MPVELGSVYSLVGGDAFFQRLVDLFYDRVEKDPILRPLFPPDLEPGKQWQFLFLRQIFGGPTDYVAERGPPRLHKRHIPFPIGLEERNRWVNHMVESLAEAGVTPDNPVQPIMEGYFSRMATKMINKPVNDAELGGTALKVE